MNIKEKTDKIKSLIEQISTHCMCLNFFEDPRYFTVHCPEGYYPNGYRIDHSEKGKIKALEELLDCLEIHWKRSFVTGE